MLVVLCKSADWIEDWKLLLHLVLFCFCLIVVIYGFQLNIIFFLFRSIVVNLSNNSSITINFPIVGKLCTQDPNFKLQIHTKYQLLYLLQLNSESHLLHFLRPFTQLKTSSLIETFAFCPIFCKYATN